MLFNTQIDEQIKIIVSQTGWFLRRSEGCNVWSEFNDKFSEL